MHPKIDTINILYTILGSAEILHEIYFQIVHMLRLPLNLLQIHKLKRISIKQAVWLSLRILAQIQQ